MSLTINTNTAAVNAAFNLAKNNQSLHKSLNRLSSGKRITKPADDAGGLAVSMKLSSSITRSQSCDFKYTKCTIIHRSARWRASGVGKNC